MLECVNAVTIEILDMDKPRVDKVLITPLDSGSPLLKSGGRATLVDEFNLLEQQLDALKEQTMKLKSRLKHKTESPNWTEAMR